MTTPVISVAMPVHRGGRWLDAALASLPGTADDPIEVIIRDSTPEAPCPAIVERHRSRLIIDYAWLPDIPSWTRKTNLCVEAATATHACVLHQDDLWLPARLPRMRLTLARQPDAVLILSPAKVVCADGRTLGEWRMPLRPGTVDAFVAREAMLIQNNAAMPAPIFRRDAYRAVGGLDEALWYTPDWDLWLKLAVTGPVVYDPVAVTAFRIHSNSLTVTGNRDEFAEQLDLVLARHMPLNSRSARICKASVRVNVLLAQAGARGDVLAFFRAIGTVLALGPWGMMKYLRGSQLVGRVMPRLRARMAHQF